ncbi:hypothetical protein GCM10023215_29690 [Pseudonocardia yuanmonensis]|uniref:Uncharacterized protein n=1 Tax=Pseudonocardia yuanmonensis TaxID=1095914 RepID=A0ABP8WJS9_9PSEU
MVALGAVLGAQTSGQGLIAALLTCIAVGGVLGLLQGWLIGRTGMNSLVVTIGSLIAVQGAAQTLAGDRTVLVSDLRVSDLLGQGIAFVLQPSSVIAIVVAIAPASSWPAPASGGRSTPSGEPGRRQRPPASRTSS